MLFIVFVERRPALLWHLSMRSRRRAATALGVAAALLACAAAGAARETKFYDALGISPDADEATIKKAYRRQAL